MSYASKRTAKSIAKPRVTAPPKGMPRRESAAKTLQAHNLARWVLGAYILLLIYASLHPLEALRTTEANPLAYFNSSRLLWAGGKPYGVGWFDALSNFAAYCPLGFGATWALKQRMPLVWAVGTALTVSTTLSIGLEALQTYNPLRVPSLWDVVINTAGAALGAVFAASFAQWRRHATLRFSPMTMVAPHAGAAWAAIGLWVLAQVHPQSWVFVTAPLRMLWGSNTQGLLELPVLNLNGAALAQLEAMVAGLALLCCLGLFRLGSRFTGHSLAARMVWMLFGWTVIVVWQGLAYLFQFGSDVFLALWAPGVWLACWLAAAAALVLGLLPTLHAAALTVAALGAYLTVVQWLPPHPYTTLASLWQYGKFTHIYGLTAAVSALWPVLALLALGLQLRYATRSAGKR